MCPYVWDVGTCKPLLLGGKVLGMFEHCIKSFSPWLGRLYDHDLEFYLFKDWIVDDMKVRFQIPLSMDVPEDGG